MLIYHPQAVRERSELSNRAVIQEYGCISLTSARLLLCAQASSRREALVRFLSIANSIGGSAVERADYEARVRTLGDGQAQLTEKALAGMLRGYSIKFQ